MGENTDPTSDKNRSRSTTNPALKQLNFFINVLVVYLVAMSLKSSNWIEVFTLTSSTVDLQKKK